MVVPLWMVLVEGPHQDLLTLQTKALCSFSLPLLFCASAIPPHFATAALYLPPHFFHSSVLSRPYLSAECREGDFFTSARIRRKEDVSKRR